MLAAELKKFSADQQQSTAQTGSNPDACNDAMRGLRIGSGGGCSSMAQSLPSHSHMAMHAAAPPRKPRVHPSPAPSFAGVPLMDLPEQSPMSTSLMDRIGERAMEKGMGVMGVAGVAEEDSMSAYGISMLAPPVSSAERSYNYAASAPASMLWGANAHKAGGSSMGGRMPSKTLLEAMSSQGGPAQ